jgi:PAS domain S-box-containing protein
MGAMSSLRREFDSVDVQVLVDSIPALIHTSRPDGHLDYFNKRWLEYLGVTLDEVAGWNWTAFIHPEDVEGILTRWRACLATGETFEYETRVRRANGDYRWMFHRKVPLRDANGNIIKWYGSSMDIDERKTAEEQLRWNAQELQRSEFYLAEGQRLAHIGSWAFDPDGFDYWSPELFRMHGLDPANKPPSVQEYLDRVHPHDRESMADLIKGILAKASPFDATKRIVRPNGEVRYIRCVGAPVVEKQSLKKYIGSAIDVTEHELLTQELRRREAYLTEAQRLSHTGSFGWNISNGDHFWSEETYHIFGLNRAVKPSLDLVLRHVHPDDRDLVRKIVHRASTDGEDFEVKYRIRLLNGLVKHLHVIAHPWKNSTGNLEFVGAVTDITATTQAVEALRRSEEHLREVIETIPAMAWTALPDGSIDFVSRSWLEYMDFSMEDWLGTGRQAAIHPDDIERTAQKWQAALATGEPYECEMRTRTASGSYRWCLSRAVPLRDESGKIVKWYAANTDIEDRKRAEEVLRESERSVRLIIDCIAGLVAINAPDGQVKYVNSQTLEYFGRTLEELKGWGTSDAVHPDDLPQVVAAWTYSVETGGTFDADQRLRGADGAYRWFHIRGLPLRDAQGRIIRWYTLLTDIDERKRAEAKLRDENIALREEIDKASMFEEIVGTSPALKSVLSRISKVAPSDSTVLITGETGTGKELVARAIHRRSERASRAFVSVNCAAIPRDLIASELFGHERGAFTGATQQRLGRFELANGGTIFLDEVGELPVETQIALLRVLQEHEFERVGGSRQIRADVRVIAATNRDLQAAIGAGFFRSDLFYRLNVFPIEIPSLRERRADIPLLVEYFIDRYARKAGKNIKRVNKKTLELLQLYPWPGNIRELQNVIERSVILCEAEIFSIDENWLLQPPPLAPESKQQVELHRRLLAQEKDMIEAALKDTRGRVSGPGGAAVKLGIPRSTLESKIRSLKINKNRFRTIPGT